VLVYEDDGRTRPAGITHERFTVTDNLHYFAELLRRVIRVASTQGPLGRLYHIDMRLRPTGGSGSLAVSLAEFRRYYEGGGAQLWERQALTRARPVAGEPSFAGEVAAAARRAAFERPWQPGWADEIVDMRERLEASRGARDLKRGWGGLADVEFLVQLFQLKYGGEHAELRTPNTRVALDALLTAGLLSPEDHDTLRSAYDFLRLVESRLRVVTNRAADALPESPADLEKLARRLGYESSDGFLADFEGHTAHTRAVFRRLCARERGN
jgi:glutamate-ammonia-ligase adenylyltransferase